MENPINLKTWCCEPLQWLRPAASSAGDMTARRIASGWPVLARVTTAVSTLGISSTIECASSAGNLQSCSLS